MIGIRGKAGNQPGSNAALVHSRRSAGTEPNNAIVRTRYWRMNTPGLFECRDTKARCRVVPTDQRTVSPAVQIETGIAGIPGETQERARRIIQPGPLSAATSRRSDSRSPSCRQFALTMAAGDRKCRTGSRIPARPRSSGSVRRSRRRRCSLRPAARSGRRAR